MILCARSTSTSREQSTKRRSRSENMRKGFIYSIVKITSSYDYQTWPTHFGREFTRCAKVCGLFSWLCLKLIGWAGKLRSHGTNEAHHAKNLVKQTNAVTFHNNAAYVKRQLFQKFKRGGGARARITLHCLPISGFKWRPAAWSWPTCLSWVYLFVWLPLLNKVYTYRVKQYMLCTLWVYQICLQWVFFDYQAMWILIFPAPWPGVSSEADTQVACAAS